ncbi:hypothetical protein M422DRAFT_206583, partial [Sphaerobolus stellatus SS14]
MRSAFAVFQEAGGVLKDPSPFGKREWPEEVTQYVWLDEFCLSEPGLKDDEADLQRADEVGRLADIFRGASRVLVFCDVVDCEHTKRACPWGHRLFTLGEILHAARVETMTRRLESSGQKISHISKQKGWHFKAKMQREAEKARQWHLYSIMQHATNSGAVTWQSAIHALIVEAIIRDKKGGFTAHKFLGKALNGLLPRRARLEDLKGKNGWEDLAWLLELNQGYYNAAILAAVCGTADFDVPDYRWLGRPLQPQEGSERLEPLVTAFPVRVQQDDVLHPALCIARPEILFLNHMLQRDPFGLYNNSE